VYEKKERSGGLAACLAKFKGVSVIGGMSMPKMNDLFSPLLFSTHNTPGCVYIYFFREQKEGGNLTRTMGKRVKEITKGVLEERLKGKEVIDRGNKSKTQRRVRGKDSKEGQVEK
jgi:hypothetical protein